MTMIKHLLAVSAFLLYVPLAIGQNFKGNMAVEDVYNPNLRGASGTGLINVDQFTGTGSVSIPIHAYSIDGVGMGVSLNYNAKGIRVDQISSSVGMGWNLSAGGSITREVFGLEDEVTLPITFKYSITDDSLQGRLVPGANFSIDTNSGNVDDKEHDLYHLNIGGRSLDFSMTYSGSQLVYQTYPHSDIKIEVFRKDLVSGSYTNVRSGFGKKTGLDQTHDIITFTVTDEKGNKYYFERGDYEIKKMEVPTAAFNSGECTYYPTTEWILTKVVTVSGKEINIEYYKKYLEYAESISEVIHPRVQQYDNDTVKYDPLQVKVQTWKGYRTHISKIIYPDGSVVLFDLDTATASRCDNLGDFRLKNIIIQNEYDQNTVNSITYKLNQAYYNSPVPGLSALERTIPSACSTLTTGILNPLSLNVDSLKSMHLSRGTRLKLKSIDKIGNDNSTTERFYSFGYNGTPLPYRCSPKKDFYGYYNNGTTYPYIRENLIDQNIHDTIYLSIPYHKDTCASYDGVDVLSANWGQVRNYNFTYAQAGVLNVLMNCGGGKDTIVYTDYTLNNPYCSYNRSAVMFWDNTVNEGGNYYFGCGDVDPKLIGDSVNDGLVVGKIISTDGYTKQNTSVTEYAYDSTQRFNRGGYISYEDNEKIAFTNYFVNPHKYFNGSNHGFGKVTVTTKGYAGQQLSKTVSIFSNLMFKDQYGSDSSCITQPPIVKTVPPDMLKYRLGRPLKVSDYDATNNLVTTQEFQYDYASYSPLIANSRDYNGAGLQWFWGYRVIDHEALLLKKTITTTYSGAKTLSATKTYFYDQYNRILGAGWKDSKGDSFKTYNYYNYKYYNDFNSSPYVDALIEMNSRGMIYQLSTETWKIKSSTDSVLLAYNMTVPYFPSGTNMPLLFKADFAAVINEPLGPTSVFPSNPASSKIKRKAAFSLNNSSGYGDNLQMTVQTTKYNSKYFGIEAKHLDKELYTSAVWDVDRFDRLVTVSNAKYDDIAYCSFESTYLSSGLDYNKGNWDFDPQFVTDAGTSMTGKYVYNLDGTDKIITGKPLHQKKYILTFWAKYSTSLPSISLHKSSGSSTITPTSQNTVNTSSPAWNLYTAVINADSGDYIEIIGNPPPYLGSQQVYIDELRLHPLDSRMVSYTYSPLFGLTSKCDASNYITYYEYDVFGRATIVRDLRQSIISQREILCANPLSSSSDYDMESSGGSGSEE